MAANFKPNEFLAHLEGTGREDTAEQRATPLGDTSGTVITIASVLLIAALATRACQYSWRKGKAEAEAAREPDLSNSATDWLRPESRFCPLCFHESCWPAEQCEDCGVMLVDEEELPEETAVQIEEGVIPVARLQNLATAYLARSYLLANRVPCTIRCAVWSSLSSDVLVFESDALRARRLLSHYLCAAAA